jgi:hypothetical protein
MLHNDFVASSVQASEYRFPNQTWGKCVLSTSPKLSYTWPLLQVSTSRIRQMLCKWSPLWQLLRMPTLFWSRGGPVNFWTASCRRWFLTQPLASKIYPWSNTANLYRRQQNNQLNLLRSGAAYVISVSFVTRPSWPDSCLWFVCTIYASPDNGLTLGSLAQLLVLAETMRFIAATHLIFVSGTLVTVFRYLHALFDS